MRWVAPSLCSILCFPDLECYFRYHRLNTVLELQLENEHLQRKLRTLKSRFQSGSSNAAYGSGFSTGLLSGGDGSNYYTGGMDGRGGGLYDANKTSGRGSFDMGGSSAALNLDTSNEEPEDGSKKKKVRFRLKSRFLFISTDWVCYSSRPKSHTRQNNMYVSPAAGQTRPSGGRFVCSIQLVSDRPFTEGITI